MAPRPIGIAMGDPAGIGPEVILKAAAAAPGRLAVIGSRAVFETAARRVGTDPLKIIPDLSHYSGGVVLLDVVTPRRFRPGRPTLGTAQMALDAVDHAIRLVKEKRLAALVTAPIWKHGIQLLRKGFVGHTEYLARAFNARPCAMMGVNRDKRILLLTTHLPLRRIFKYITEGNIKRHLKLLDTGLKKTFGIRRPRIGVTNLNPHGREFSLGEDEIIHKAVKAARRAGILAWGPFPSDTVFNQPYDGFLAMYHDQGMVFLKSRPGGVNFTVGLPFVRTSPLHGTAFDIAARHEADPRSMIDAIELAFRLSKGSRHECVSLRPKAPWGDTGVSERDD